MRRVGREREDPTGVGVRDGANTSWLFADGDEAGTTVLTAEFDFKLPGGITGKVLGGIIGPFTDQAVRYTESKTRAACEG